MQAITHADGLVASEAAFLDAHPSFRETAVLDELRASEYARLDARGEVYLDYCGGSLYATSQVEEHQRLLRETVFGNPHSANPTSSAATALVERARAAVLRYFRASESEYECIFTANATGALRLVGEAYPFGPAGRFLATSDNHNSVNGIREFARAKGARTAYVPLECPDLRVDDEVLLGLLDDGDAGSSNLFAFPAQSNFSGVKHPLEWIAPARERGWDVLVDGAAFVPTNRLDLSVWTPDFVAISFYKLFGYPTGLGALLARRDALRRLDRPWFAGGTVVAANVGGDLVVPLSGHAGFEDGTVDYLGIPAVEIGLRHVERVGIDLISRRVEALGTWLLAGLSRVRHADGAPRGPCLRPGGVGRPRCHDRVELPAPRRPRGRRAIRRHARRGPRHLGPDRMLLQPGGGRGRVPALARRAGRCRVRRRHDPRRLHHAHRHALGRRRPRLARARQQLRRRPPLHGVRDAVPRSGGRAAAPAAQARLLTEWLHDRPGRTVGACPRARPVEPDGCAPQR